MNAGRSLRERCLILVLRGCLRLYLGVTPAVKRPRGVRSTGPLTVLLTGTFHSDNWAAAHLVPLARALRGGKVVVVSTFPLTSRDGVQVVAPPTWLHRMAGGVAARLLTFAWLSMRLRPDVIGGFHLLFNGMAAALLARLAGSSALYFCVGGDAEVKGGGLQSENRLFGRLSAPEPTLEHLLHRVVRRFDLIVTMGSRAASYLRATGVQGRVLVNGGGIDSARFGPGDPRDKDIDVLYVGRLVPIKRIDRLIKAVKLVSQSQSARAELVGDGPLADDLRNLARALGVGHAIHFAGQQSEVAPFLRRSRIFILTSESEGVALSMLEAMTAGVVPVVADVGDLGDAVEDGRSGFLLSDPTPEALAERLLLLLGERQRLASMADAARSRAALYSIEASVARWKAALTDS